MSPLSRTALTTLLAVAGLCTSDLRSQTLEQPNILVIFTDDVGLSNVGAYHQGLMSGRTPNIDALATEGMRFTDDYAQPSCTAGRSTLLTGQFPVRTGMHTVGLPGGPIGLSADTPTVAELLREQGYATGQFGKNHLGDRDEFLPTMHAFAEEGQGAMAR